ncbi:hypothetical protein IHQ71_24350 [Rhizobium sp. TH2]|uniref:HAD family hydrolase n=1 Tax=Rhizobium sp. TH2 TaxID=2775403 RepID=UPI0021587340|nr:HAD family hydrolase [Rhizobium sp. TH2]UVC08248.1 hypothetical protein IHQ71_24350 [Rhizobium sp. TH2]
MPSVAVKVRAAHRSYERNTSFLWCRRRVARKPATPERRYHGIVMLRRTIPNDAKKTKSCPYLASINSTQKNVNVSQFASDKLTHFGKSEKLVSDSERLEDEFSALPLGHCDKLMAARVCRRHKEDAMRNATTPKLVVCDLDQNLLHNREAESVLLDTWMMWERGHRPLLLFHSARTTDELQRLLPSSVLPPPDFLIGGGTGLLVRHSFWNHKHSEECGGEFAGFAPERLLASMASKALAQLNSPLEDVASPFPKVETAALTLAGPQSPRVPVEYFILTGVKLEGPVIGTLNGRPIRDIAVSEYGDRYRFVGVAPRELRGRYDVSALTDGEWIVEPGLVYRVEATTSSRRVPKSK